MHNSDWKWVYSAYLCVPCTTPLVEGLSDATSLFGGRSERFCEPADEPLEAVGANPVGHRLVGHELEDRFQLLAEIVQCRWMFVGKSTTGCVRRSDVFGSSQISDHYQRKQRWHEEGKTLTVPQGKPNRKAREQRWTYPTYRLQYIGHKGASSSLELYFVSIWWM